LVERVADLITFNALEQLRSAADLINLSFIFDEHSDKVGASEARGQVRVILDALHHPENPRPEGEWIGGEVARQ
jgi:hypothetical protein